VRPAPSPTPAAFPFYDGFETGSLDQAWMVDFTNEGRVRIDTTIHIPVPIACYWTIGERCYLLHRRRHLDRRPERAKPGRPGLLVAQTRR